MADSTTDPEMGGRREGPRGHEAGPRTDDRTIPRRVFLAVGLLIGVLAAVYAATAYEEAGTVMLVLAAVFGLWFGTYLWLQQRPGAAPEHGIPEYLPHASVWPFAIGLGVATIANGLALGIWVTIPGLAILALGVGGLARQSRDRT